MHQVAAQITTIPGRATMAAAQADIAALQSEVTGQGKTISHIQGQSSTYANCIPELQTELNGLSISWSLTPLNASSTTSTSPTAARSPTIARSCSTAAEHRAHHGRTPPGSTLTPAQAALPAIQNAVPASMRTRNWTTALLACEIYFGDCPPA